MITQNHDTKYDFLYSEALKVLHKYHVIPEEVNQINSIDEYFNYLQDLARLENENDDLDPIFTMIPATENTFVIDANTRSVTVPSEFTAGVGVQGDDIAEIIYFEIDRYFDAVDLATMKILVQWCRAGKENSTSSGDQHLAATYKKSLTLKQGKIIFGWPITAEMTEESGDIVFSVRFYKEIIQNDKIVGLQYSFGTSPAKIKIKKGLNFEITDSTIIELANSDMSARIYNNLRGPIQLPNAVLVAAPSMQYYKYIYINDEGEAVAISYNSDDNDKNLVHDLSNNLQFVVKAYVDEESVSETGVHHRKDDLIYAWSREPDSDDNDIHDAFESKINYIKINGAEPYNEFEIYYIKPNEEKEEYVNAEIANEEDYSKQLNNLYVCESVCIPKMAGQYSCKVTNVYNAASFNEIISEPWIVPFPDAPAFETFDAIQAYDNAHGLDANIITNETDAQAFQWFKKDEDQLIAIENATAENYIPTAEGVYAVQVTNSRNNYSKTRTSGQIEAVHAPAAPELIFKLNEVNVGSICTGPVGSTLQVFVTNTDAQYVDALSYEWKLEANTIGNSDTITVSNTGSYKCTVTNNYRGFSTTTVQSITFVVETD